MNIYERQIEQIKAARTKYTSFAMTNEEKVALPVGTHYFKAIFDSVECGKDKIGYYRTFKESVKACKAFAEVELEEWYNEEFDIIEYEVGRKEDGSFVGMCVDKSTNVYGLKFESYYSKDGWKH